MSGRRLAPRPSGGGGRGARVRRRAAARDVSAAAGARVRARAQIALELFEVMTPEQRARLRALREQRRTDTETAPKGPRGGAQEALRALELSPEQWGQLRDMRARRE